MASEESTTQKGKAETAERSAGDAQQEIDSQSEALTDYGTTLAVAKIQNRFQMSL